MKTRDTIARLGRLQCLSARSPMRTVQITYEKAEQLARLQCLSARSPMRTGEYEKCFKNNDGSSVPFGKESYADLP